MGEPTTATNQDDSGKLAGSEQTTEHQSEGQERGLQKGGERMPQRRHRARRGDRDLGQEFDAFRGMVGRMMDDFDNSFIGGRGGMSRPFGGDSMLSLMPFSNWAPRLPNFFSGGRNDPLQIGDETNSSDALTTMDSPLDILRTGDRTPALLKLDVEEEKDKYIVTAEAPGFSKDDLHVNVENGYLTIQGEHRENREDKSRKFLRTERRVQGVYRSIALGNNVDQTPDKVKARYQDGLLKIEIPKLSTDANRSGKIEISSNVESGDKK